MHWQRRRSQLYDYIIHDVFTGGAVPSSLFTESFWSSLLTLLHPSGGVAINFAGSLSSPSSKYILSTLLTSFPHCRAFEDRPSTHTDPDSNATSDPEGFKNLVVFCTASWFNPVKFRDPLPADFLPSGPSPGIRKRVFSRYKGDEVDLSPFAFGEDSWSRREKERWMFRKGMESVVEREQRGEVEMHWETMRGVLPDEVWARW
jgi:hypothetical protein